MLRLPCSSYQIIGLYLLQLIASLLDYLIFGPFHAGAGDKGSRIGGADPVDGGPQGDQPHPLPHQPLAPQPTKVHRQSL